MLQLTKAKYVIISNGKNNRYGHPYPELFERIENVHSERYITNVDGAIMIKTDGVRLEIPDE